MKKIFLFMAMAGMAALTTSCVEDDDTVYQDNDTISEVFEVTNVDFTPANNFSNLFNLNPEIYGSDNVLVYELTGSNGGNDLWSLLPQVYYFPEGSAQYNYEFSANTFRIFVDGDFDLGLLPTGFTQDKVFRIVIVPGYFSSTVDVSNYDAVMSALEANGNVQVIEQ